MNTIPIWMSVFCMLFEHADDSKFKRIKFICFEGFDWDTVLMIGATDQCCLVDTGQKDGLTMNKLTDALIEAPQIVEEIKKLKKQREQSAGMYYT